MQFLEGNVERRDLIGNGCRFASVVNELLPGGLQAGQDGKGPCLAPFPKLHQKF